MARKRMISPEIWESQDFSELSDVAKIVFISLFSHADDEGRGRADTGFVKSMTFPYDASGRRVADVKQALSEIALRMSVQFYSVNGSDYYFMTSWKKWQKVEKPSQSKLPPPPIVGEGGDVHSAEKFPERSPNIPRTFPEPSPTNRMEKNIKEYPPTPQRGKEWAEAKERFLNAYPKLKAWKKYDDRNVDYKVLYDCFAKSAHLRDTYSMKWVCENYELIASGVFEDSEKKPAAFQNEAAIAADMRGERERYYAALHEKAIDRAEKMRKKAEENAEYRQANSEMRACELALARAEATNSDMVPERRKALELLMERRTLALLKIGMTDSDLLPNYFCKKCSDTGFMKNGQMCDCYLGGTK